MIVVFSGIDVLVIDTIVIADVVLLIGEFAFTIVLWSVSEVAVVISSVSGVVSAILMLSVSEAVFTVVLLSVRDASVMVSSSVCDVVFVVVMLCRLRCCCDVVCC